MIKVERKQGEILSIIINGVPVGNHYENVWVVPKGLLKGIHINELPKDVEFELCNRYEENTIFLDSVPTRLRRTDNSKVTVVFDDSGTRKYWDGQIGFKPYMEAKRAVVEERMKEVGDITFKSYEDDGAYIWLSYSAEIETELCDTAVEMAEQIAAEIEGAAEMRLGGQLWKLRAVSDEKQFTLQIVLPILRKLGFYNVRYNHGKREYGKDVLFARRTEFDELEHWAAQIKFGDISGGAGSEIDTILGQLDDAFKMPFYDIYTRQRQRISKMMIIISGKFTENAIEKICEKIEIHAIRNNLVFIDGEKVETLAERLRT